MDRTQPAGTGEGVRYRALTRKSCHPRVTFPMGAVTSDRLGFFFIIIYSNPMSLNTTRLRRAMPDVESKVT